MAKGRWDDKEERCASRIHSSTPFVFFCGILIFAKIYIYYGIAANI